MTNPIATSSPVTISSLSSVNVNDPKFKADPFPFYAQLRAEAPVFQTRVRPHGRAWLVTRYNDVAAILKDERFAKDPRNAMTPDQLTKLMKLPSMFKALQQGLLGIDDPDHARLRHLIHKAFTPGLIEQMRDQVQILANELLDNAERKGSMDLIEDYAAPLPLTVIGRILGMPPQDNHKFYKWTKTFVNTGTSNLFVLVPTLLRFMSYLRALIKERRAHPKDDLISAMVLAKEGTDQMTDDEVLAMIFLLLSAGHETTVNLIGSGTLALLQHPEQMALWRNDPSLAKSAIEELVRFVCPVEMATERYPREDVVIAGTTIPRGELVVAVIGSANRDAGLFLNPDTLDIKRENNKHLGFGLGTHYCIGAPLARLEGQISLTTLLSRFSNLRLQVPPDQLPWRGTFILRGLQKLPVTF
jgi:cytochrome P450